jgi:hypothetical protein
MYERHANTALRRSIYKLGAQAMRRPSIYLLVILPLLLLGGIVSSLVVGAYAASRAIPIAAIPQVNALLLAIPTLSLWIPLALLLANVILNAVPPLRRTAEGFTAIAGRPAYPESKRQLRTFLAWSALVCIPLIALGWLV